MLNNLKEIIFNNPSSKNAKIIHILLISFTTILIYLNIFQNTFILDDRTIFFNWPEVKNLNIKSLIQGSYPQRFENEPAYRPVKSIIHAIDYHLFNNLAFFYQIQAILIHLAITLLIYFIVNLLTKKTSIAFITSLIFGIHPIHTEAVTFMTASFDTIGILFFFMSLYLFLKYKTEKINQSIYFSASLLFSGLAFFTYEMTFSLPAILILYDLIFAKLNIKFIKNFLIYIPYFLLVGLYFILKTVFLPQLNNAAYFGGSLVTTMITMLKALLNYILLFVFPYNLSLIQVLPGGIEANFGASEALVNQKLLQQSILEPWVILSLFLIITSMIIFYFSYKKFPIISFGIGWFFLALIPASNIIPLKQIMAIRYEYIASFGLILITAFLFNYFYNHQKTTKAYKYILIFLLIILTVGLSFRTYLRNLDYKDHITMLESISQQKIGGQAAQYYLGKYYFYNKDFSQSVYYLEKLTLSSYEKIYKDAYSYIILSYINQNKLDLARKAYDKLVSTQPDYDIKNLDAIKNILFNKNTSSNTNQKDGKYYHQNFSFVYLKGWIIKQLPTGMIIEKSEGNGNIQINYSVLVGTTSTSDYIKNKANENYGKLIKEGRAKIPSVEYAYVKIWEDNGISKGQFFLFKDKHVLELIAWPFIEANINDVNQLLNSLTFVD